MSTMAVLTPTCILPRISPFITNLVSNAIVFVSSNTKERIIKQLEKRRLLTFVESSSAAFVSLTNLRYPTVVLEHIDYVTGQTCMGDVFEIQFNDETAYRSAVPIWSANVATGLVFLVYCPTCGSAHPGDRAWILVYDITIDWVNLTVSCHFTEIQIEDIGSTVQVALGTTTVTSSGPSPPVTRNSGSVLPSTLSRVTSLASTGGLGSGPSFNSSRVVILASGSSGLGSASTSTSTKASGSSTSPTALSTSSPSDDLDFDVALDKTLGYLDPNSPGFWAQLMPGVTGLDTSQFGTPDTLSKRTFNLGAIADTLTTVSMNF
jgi:hypothetical protein